MEITERTDITPLLGINWMKRFKLTIGKIQLAENNQSEKENIRKIPRLVREQRNNKRYRNKNSTQTGTLPSQTRSKTGTVTSTGHMARRFAPAFRALGVCEHS